METNEQQQRAAEQRQLSELEKIEQRKAELKIKEQKRDARLRISIRRVMGGRRHREPVAAQSKCHWCGLDYIRIVAASAEFAAELEAGANDGELLHPEPIEKCPGPPVAEDYPSPVFEPIVHPRVAQMRREQQERLARPPRVVRNISGERDDD